MKVRLPSFKDDELPDPDPVSQKHNFFSSSYSKKRIRRNQIRPLIPDYLKEGPTSQLSQSPFAPSPGRTSHHQHSDLDSGLKRTQHPNHLLNHGLTRALLSFISPRQQGEGSSPVLHAGKTNPRFTTQKMLVIFAKHFFVLYLLLFLVLGKSGLWSWLTQTHPSTLLLTKGNHVHHFHGVKVTVDGQAGQAMPNHLFPNCYLLTFLACWRETMAVAVPTPSTSLHLETKGIHVTFSPLAPTLYPILRPSVTGNYMIPN